MTTTNNNSNNQKNTNNAATNIIPQVWSFRSCESGQCLVQVSLSFWKQEEMDVDQTYETMMMLMFKNSNKGYPIFIWAQCQTWWNNAICTGWNKQHYAATANKNVFQGNLKSPFLAFFMKSSFRFLHEPKAPSVSWLDQVILFTQVVIFAWGWIRIPSLKPTFCP